MASSETGQNRAPLDEDDVVIVITYAPEPSQMVSGSLQSRAMTPPAAIAQAVPSVIVIAAIVTCPVSWCCALLDSLEGPRQSLGRAARCWIKPREIRHRDRRAFQASASWV
jgi:hypothetical protein